MRINNYRGTVADRPMDTVVVEPVATQTPQLPANSHGFMSNILAHLTNQSNAISAGDLPVYDKG